MRNLIWCISEGMEDLMGEYYYYQTASIPDMPTVLSLSYQNRVIIWKPVSMGPTRLRTLPYSYIPKDTLESEIIKTTPYGY